MVAYVREQQAEGNTHRCVSRSASGKPRWHLESTSQDLENIWMKRSAEQSAMKDGYWDNRLVHCTVLDRSVQTGTSRSAASALDCCHSYMQQVRNAVALVLLKEQQKAIESWELSQVGIYILTFDETEQRMRVDGIAFIFHLFMIAGSLSWQTSATAPFNFYPLTARPAVIQHTTAECM